MSKSRLVVFLVLITLFVALLIFNDIRWNFAKENQTHITLITEAKYGEEWERIISGAKAAASEFGLELKLLAPDYEKAFDAQIGLVEDSRTQGTDGIILAPIDAYELSASIVDAVDSGIPVISTVTPVSHLGLIEYVGTNHYATGEALAKLVIDQYGLYGSVAVVTVDGEDPNLQLREEGFRSYMDKNSQINLSSTYTSAKDAYSVVKVVEAILVASKVEVIVGMDLVTTTGISEAVDLNDANVSVFGIDISETIASKIDRGIVDGVVARIISIWAT